MPPGERVYLSSLRCPDGSKPTNGIRYTVGPRTAPADRNDPRMFEQLHRAPAPGEPDLHIIDAYPMECPMFAEMVYLDMYHCDVPPPSVAPANFTFEPAQ